MILEEALYQHILAMPSLTGLTTSELFQDERPMDMVDLNDKNRKINLVIEKVGDNIGNVENCQETYNFRILGYKDNVETEKKMKMLKDILGKELNGTWGYLNNLPNSVGDSFRLHGSNLITSTENIDYETQEREIVMRFEFFYQKTIPSGLNLGA